MSNLKTTKALISTFLVMGSCAVYAQTNGTNANMPTQAASSAEQTTKVGVTPAEASKAVQKAVPRSNVATVVRTAPDAVDSVTKDTDMSNANGDKNVATSSRKARADRN